MTSLRCPLCGRSFEPPARFCTQDGTPLPGAPPLLGASHRTTPRRTMRTPPGAFRHTTPLNPLHPGDVLDRRYVIQERVAVGGMAAVYRAVDRTTEAPVAIKMLLGTLTRATATPSPA